MRLNEPVSQREFEFPDDTTLMSMTDLQSNVTYVNEAFVSVSGFSRQEIIGQPHNLVRHPDMPTEAFADMWATLKGGQPWTAVVKNRRKDGDHYWVRANVVPVVRDGHAVGYMSVRTKPSREEIAGAEQLYRKLRQGHAGGRKFHKGLVVRTGPASLLSLGKTLSSRGRIRLAMAGMWLVCLLGGMLLASDWTGLAKFGTVAAVAALVVSFVLEKEIARPLERLLARALSVASGESRKIEEAGRVDEIGLTQRAIGQLGLMFEWLADDVRAQTATVQASAAEMAQAGTDLSTRTEQTASSVQETASAMGQMTASVKNNADTAQQANELAGNASAAAIEGGRAVSHVVATMSDISASSRKIEDIIGVIDGIAFQTNILALNAAVEAARAGEQGRGFAVVASEVRNLAQRSATAAKEIKSLIASSVEKVEFGSNLVNESGATMNDIVAKVKRVTDLIAEISSSTLEQSSAITQVSQAMSHLDEITHQNVELVEQGAESSKALTQHAVRLAEAVAVFC